MLAAEKSAIGRKGTWVHRFKLFMNGVCYELGLVFGIGAPKQEDNGCLLFVKL